MASTIQLARTIARSQQMIRLAPLTFAANTYNDPAFSNADWVMQEILSPSLGGWRWNRSSATIQAPTFSTIVGQTDYVVSLPTFGWIEKAVAYDTADGNKGYELQVALILGAEAGTGQPARISAQYDNGAGEITFRVFPAPNKIYSVVVDYQNSAPQFTAPTQTWSPIPDYLSVVYNSGFDGKAYEYMNDPRYQGAMQIFYTNAAAYAEGLSETQRNLWVQDKLNSIREMQAVQQGKR